MNKKYSYENSKLAIRSWYGISDIDTFPLNNLYEIKTDLGMNMYEYFLQSSFTTSATSLADAYMGNLLNNTIAATFGMKIGNLNQDSIDEFNNNLSGIQKIVRLYFAVDNFYPRSVDINDLFTFKVQGWPYA